MTSTAHSPLLILGSHRSGTSVATGLLASAGLRLGPVLPPRTDNKSGFFESEPLHIASVELLRSMRRDWTCPPAALDPGMIDRDALTAALAAAGWQGDAPWGFKNPRTLFTLRAWLEVLPEIRFIGIYRSTAAIASSIEARNRFPRGAAEQIAIAYTKRLADLVRHLGFPVVRFGDESLLARIEQLAIHLDLDWDPEKAAEFLDPDLMHHHDPEQLCDDDQYLVDQSTRPVVEIATHFAPDVRSVLELIESPSIDLDRHLGPAHAEDRRRAWRLARNARTQISHVSQIGPDHGPPSRRLPGIRANATSNIPISDLIDGRPVQPAAPGSESHILGPGALEAVPPEALAEFFVTLAEATDPKGVAVVGGIVIEDDYLPPEIHLPQLDLTFHRAAPPYFHHRADIEAALVRTSWTLTRWEVHARHDQWVTLVLEKSPRSKPLLAAMTSTALRRELDLQRKQLDERLEQIAEQKRAIAGATDQKRRHETDLRIARVELRREQTERKRAHRQLAKATEHARDTEIRLAQIAAAHDQLRAAIAAKEEIIAAKEDTIAAKEDTIAAHEREAAEQDNDLAAARFRLTALRKEADQQITELAATRADLDAARNARKQAQHELRRTTARYRRLRGRRSVRLALATAALFRPLFKFWRRSARPKGGEGTGRSKTPNPGAARSPATAKSNPAAASESEPETSPPLTEVNTPTTWSVGEVGRPEPISIIIPIHNAFEEVSACIESVIRNTKYPAEILLIDDTSTDERIGHLLSETAARTPHIQALSNETNLGFTGTVNRGFAATTGDVVILNSDVEVVPGWLRRIALTAKRHPDAATVTPLSDNAGAFSAPANGRKAQTPSTLTKDEVGRLVARESRHIHPRVPTGNGFCMFIRREALTELGGFDAEAFPRGYGEENDFCQRAVAAGWTNIIDDSTYVFHARGASFGPEKEQLIAAGRQVLDDRYPNYSRDVRAFVQSPEMEACRSEVADAFASAAAGPVLPRVLFVLHQASGGTPATTADLMGALAGRFDSFLLISDADSLTLFHYQDGASAKIATWRLRTTILPTESTRVDYQRVLSEILVTHDIELVHIRHFLGHTFDLPRVAKLHGLPVVLSFHDFFLVCPTVHLLDENLIFCGGTCTPTQGACAAPGVWRRFDLPHLKHSWVYSWRETVSTMFRDVDAFATTSSSAHSIITNTYPQLTESRFEVIEHGRDLPPTPPDAFVPTLPPPGEPVRILLPGNIGAHKGANYIRRIKELDTDGRLEFHILGSVAGIYKDIGKNHGTYLRAEFAERATSLNPTFVGIFSIWAETYSHVLTEAWATGIPVIALDFGAVADRIRLSGGGWVLDSTDPADTYRDILRIVADRSGYHDVVTGIPRSVIRTTAEMALDYEHLYKDLLARTSSFFIDATAALGASPPVRVGVFTSGPVPSADTGETTELMDLALQRTISAGVAAIELDIDRFVEQPDTASIDVALVDDRWLSTHPVERLVKALDQRRIPLILRKTAPAPGESDVTSLLREAAGATLDPEEPEPAMTLLTLAAALRADQPHRASRGA